MPDVLDRIRDEMSVRLAELRLLVDEHARLSAALQALGDVDSRARLPAAPSPTARSKSRAPKQTPPTARKRAPRGANRLAVLRAAEDRPGATSAELATISGVQASTLHALLARLVKSGELQKRNAADRSNRIRTRSDAAWRVSRLGTRRRRLGVDQVSPLPGWQEGAIMSALHARQLTAIERTEAVPRRSLRIAVLASVISVASVTPAYAGGLMGLLNTH